MKYQGSYCALITPFDQDRLDRRSYKNIIKWQILNGIKGIIPCGTTGESPTLSHDEHKEIIELAVETANKEIQVMAGTGSNSTSEAVSLTKHAKLSGADSALVVVPYYNKPSQKGLYEHYIKIADSVDLPIFIYNIPGRSVVDINNDVIAKLAEHENIIGIKDASNDLTRPKVLKNLITHKHFYQLSGEDSTQLHFLSEGGDGVISVTANIAPKLIAQLHEFWTEKRYQDSIEINNLISELNRILFLEANPCPVKFAAYKMGICNNEIRLPLTCVTNTTQNLIIKMIEKLGLTFSKLE